MLGFIGTGLMGFPMARRLLQAGHDLIVYNRTREKALPLGEQGAKLADAPDEVFRRADVVFLMLTDAPATREALQSVSRTERSRKTLIQMATILPTESQEFSRWMEEAGGTYLEAPVLGSTPEARDGKLIVMVGGSRAVFQQVQPLLQHFGPDPVYLGEVGKATAAKLALNQLIASLITAFSVSLGMVQAHGVEVQAFMDILRRSALYAPMFDKKLERLLTRHFDQPNFPVKHLLKDVNLITTAAKQAGVNSRVLESIRQLLTRAMDKGLQDQDYSAIFQVIYPGEAQD
ncbi:MAG: NAD(P)-dependent oxidoreductase [Calditrichaeota bacterium]|nr:NAD(P)-dependent oxidoreductase [Calditrichota bacterium]